MRQVLGVAIHLAHLALLLIAMLDDSRVRRPTRLVDRLVLEPRAVPRYPWYPRYDRVVPDVAPEVAPAPRCPMPLWRPDPNVRYAVLVAQVGRPTGDFADQAGLACVNTYGRAAAYP